MLVIPIPLFFPWIPTVMVAKIFPKTTLILLHEANAAHPFGTLPKIKVRHHHASWPAMFRCERFVIIFQGNKGLTIDHICERHIGSVTAITKSSDEHGFTI